MRVQKGQLDFGLESSTKGHTDARQVSGVKSASGIEDLLPLDSWQGVAYSRPELSVDLFDRSPSLPAARQAALLVIFPPLLPLRQCPQFIRTQREVVDLHAQGVGDGVG